MPSVACPVQGEDAAGWIGFRLTFDKSGYLQHRSNESAAELLKAADDHLYRAKQANYVSLKCALTHIKKPLVLETL